MRLIKMKKILSFLLVLALTLGMIPFVGMIGSASEENGGEGLTDGSNEDSGYDVPEPSSEPETEPEPEQEQEPADEPDESEPVGDDVPVVPEQEEEPEEVGDGVPVVPAQPAAGLEEELGEDEPLEMFDYFDPETSEQIESAEFDKDTILIKFHPAADFPGQEKQYQDSKDKVLKWGFEYIEKIDIYVVNVEDLDKNPNAVLNRFKNNKFIERVEPNYLRVNEFSPSDPAFNSYKSAYNILTLPDGWDITQGEGSPIIAVVDSGVIANHPDLPTLLPGYSAVSTLSPNTDTKNHGTGVAGTLGAVGNNGIGAIGINWNARIMPVKVDDSSGTMSVSNLAKGIIWAADNGAKIINLSLGGASSSTTEQNAIDYAYNKGVALFAATGNAGSSSISYPARYPNVMAVGSTGNGTSRLSSSNYGTGMDVVALSSWYTTNASRGYTTMSGTSFATPQVAGLASLIWAVAPNLSNAQVYDLIRNNAKTLGGGYNTQTGYGLIDTAKTLTAAKALGGGGSAAPVTPTPAPDTTKPVITLKGAANITLNEGDTYVEPGYTATDNIDGDITSAVKITGTAATAYAGTYTLTYTVSDKAGNTATATRTITVKAVPVPAVKPPIITQVGSNPIILHLGGSAYVEQGAIATCEIDGDISNKIVRTGSVDTSKAGTYKITYSVTNSAGLSASITRDIRVLAPTETITRRPYSFNGQGKKNASFNYTVDAEEEGIMTLSVTGLNKTTVRVRVVNSAKTEVFRQDFAGNATKEFNVSAGKHTIEVTILEGNGNCSFGLSILMPEVVYVEFAEAEVPLNPGDGLGDDNDFGVFIEEQAIPLASIDDAALAGLVNPRTSDSYALYLCLLLIIPSAALIYFAKKSKRAVR